MINIFSSPLIFVIVESGSRKKQVRWVKDSRKTPNPSKSNYADAISRVSVRIIFAYATSDGVEAMVVDILKIAILQALTSEKHYIMCGGAFVEKQNGKVVLIIRALHYEKSAEANHL